MKRVRVRRSLAWIVGTALLLTGAFVLLILRLQSNHAASAGGNDRNGLPKGSISYQQVSAHEEASLIFPGAHFISHFGGPQTGASIDSTGDYAFAGGILTSSRSMRPIYAWYDRWLLVQGWRTHLLPSLGIWKSWRDYERGTREAFTIAEENPTLFGGQLRRRLPHARTSFEISYAIEPYCQRLP